MQQEKEQTRREKPDVDAVAALHSKSATLKVYLVKNDTTTEIDTEKNFELIRELIHSYEDVWVIRTDQSKQVSNPSIFLQS
ncbi:MAG TPA: hypothetical protein VGT05_04080 [Patescibacteria group bacterium]|nr:hypothetical protein [Patescibacteria group bacterium]